MPGTRKLGRNTDHRMATLRNLVTSLLKHGRIVTTIHKAKEVRSLTEKMITLGKENTLHSKRQALAFITKEKIAEEGKTTKGRTKKITEREKTVVMKLFDEIAPKYSERNGGYTRIIKMGPRRGDGAEMAIIELVE